MFNLYLFIYYFLQFWLIWINQFKNLPEISILLIIIINALFQMRHDLYSICFVQRFRQLIGAGNGEFKDRLVVFIHRTCFYCPPIPFIYILSLWSAIICIKFKIWSRFLVQKMDFTFIFFVKILNNTTLSPAIPLQVVNPKENSIFFGKSATCYP